MEVMEYGGKQGNGNGRGERRKRPGFRVAKGVSRS